MQDNNMDYVPANIVKMLFEQSQNAINANTVAIKEMTNAMHELSRTMVAPPTKQNILDEIREHEDSCGERVRETCQLIDEIVKEEDEKQKSKKIEVEKQFNTISLSLDSIKGLMDGLLSRVNLMITVVLIVFSIAGAVYMFVTNSVNSSVKQALDDHIKVETNTSKPVTGVTNATK